MNLITLPSLTVYSEKIVIVKEELIMLVEEVNVSELNLDPKRFQYKVIHGKNGETGSLSGVKFFNPYLAGIVLIWVDRETGLKMIVNGHNRYGLAVKAGTEKILCKYIDVPTAKEARLIGALTNIAEGQGTAIDTAKFFRDSSYTINNLEEFGINPKLKIVQEGLSLSNLHKSLFDKVVSGELTIERGVLLGNLPGMREQLEVAELIKQHEAKRKITTELIAELCDTVVNAGSNQQTLFDLFGNQDKNTQERALTRLQLIATVRNELKKSKRLYKTVANQNNAERLESVGNFINTEINASVANQATTALGVFEQLKNQNSPVSDLLNKATEKIMGGGKTKDVETDLIKELNSAIAAMLKTV